MTTIGTLAVITQMRSAMTTDGTSGRITVDTFTEITKDTFF